MLIIILAYALLGLATVVLANAIDGPDPVFFDLLNFALWPVALARALGTLIHRRTRPTYRS